MTEISHRVRQVREALGMSQTDFAERMRYGRQHISSIERGKTPAGRRFMEQLAMLEREVAIRTTGAGNASSEPAGQNVLSDSDEMTPPHTIEPHRLREEPGSYGAEKPPPSHNDYLEAIKILNRLMDRSPDSFRVALATLRAMDQNVK